MAARISNFNTGSVGRANTCYFKKGGIRRSFPAAGSPQDKRPQGVVEKPFWHLVTHALVKDHGSCRRSPQNVQKGHRFVRCSLSVDRFPRLIHCFIGPLIQWCNGINRQSLSVIRFTLHGCRERCGRTFFTVLLGHRKYPSIQPMLLQETLECTALFLRRASRLGYIAVMRG